MPQLLSNRSKRKKAKTSRLRRLLHSLVMSRLEEVPFIIFLSFLVTFIVARSYVYLTSKDILEFKYLLDNVTIHGVHVHHLNFGIFILAVTGFAALYDLRPVVHRKLAVLYGIGLGLTFDEFALWLQLKDDYYAKLSYDAVIIIAVVLLNIAYFPDFWKKRGSQVVRTLSTIKELLTR